MKFSRLNFSVKLLVLQIVFSRELRLGRVLLRRFESLSWCRSEAVVYEHRYRLVIQNWALSVRRGFRLK